MKTVEYIKKIKLMDKITLLKELNDSNLSAKKIKLEILAGKSSNSALLRNIRKNIARINTEFVNRQGQDE